MLREGMRYTQEWVWTSQKRSTIKCFRISYIYHFWGPSVTSQRLLRIPWCFFLSLCVKWDQRVGLEEREERWNQCPLVYRSWSGPFSFTEKGVSSESLRKLQLFKEKSKKTSSSLLLIIMTELHSDSWIVRFPTKIPRLEFPSPSPIPTIFSVLLSGLIPTSISPV